MAPVTVPIASEHTMVSLCMRHCLSFTCQEIDVTASLAPEVGGGEIVGEGDLGRATGLSVALDDGRPLRSFGDGKSAIRTGGLKRDDVVPKLRNLK